MRGSCLDALLPRPHCPPLTLPNAKLQPLSDSRAVRRTRRVVGGGRPKQEAGSADLGAELADTVGAVRIGHALAAQSARLPTWVTAPSS